MKIMEVLDKTRSWQMDENLIKHIGKKQEKGNFGNIFRAKF